MDAMQDAVRKACELLQAAGIDSARLDAQLLLAHALGTSREAWLMMPDRLLSGAERAQYDGYVQRRAAREPLSHILGIREFYGREFSVSRHVLDPRADSETLIDAVLKECAARSLLPASILDLGTGSGCLLLTLLAEMKGVYGVGVDVSAQALCVARANALALGLSARASFVQGRWSEGLHKKFDIIISNPPYIPSQEIEGLMPEVRDFEPLGALDGGKDGLDSYREMANQLNHALAPGGLAALEVGIGQHEAVAGIMNTAGLRILNIWNDLAGIPRCLTLTHR